ncbi:PilT protein [Candidatus Magnetoovum chiemensis]|nr:PilT protein [Candidatus Magnetoovum chiemensis]
MDSNILISGLDPKDLFYNQCLPLFEKLLKRKIKATCPALVLAETICTIRRRTNEKVAHRTYQRLLKVSSIQWVDITTETIKQACDIGITTALKGSDAIILQTAQEYNIPLLTKDNEIKEKAKKLENIKIFEPIDVL